MASTHANDAPRSLTDIVSSPDVAGLVRRAGKLADLGARLNRVLPPALAGQVTLANLRERKLVFLATTPAWATRLHYSQPIVLEAARQLGLDVQGIVIKLSAPPAAKAAGPASPPPSQAALRHLELAARLLDRP